MLITPIQTDFNINHLVDEYYKFVESKLEEVHSSPPVLVQKRYVLRVDNNTSDLLGQMEYTSSIINKVIEQLKDHYDCNKIVYRIVMPNTCYRWHVDTKQYCQNKKIFYNYHIPIITNEGCWFVYSGQSYCMPADGTLYRVQSSVPHSFMNAGNSPRVHLMFDD